MADEGLILILSASAGAGHLVAAQALRHEFLRQRPHAAVEMIDVLSISNPLFRQLYAGGYLGMVQYLPVAMGVLYEAMDRPGGRLFDWLRIGIQNLNRLPVRRRVLQCRPRLIVNTHYLPAEFVAQLRRDRLLRCPQVVITTDFETHRIWAQEPAERYYTATEEGRFYLTTWGVSPDRVRVTGIPVRPGFDCSLSPADARARCQLDPGTPVVLLLCGGFGVGPTVDLLRELGAMPAQAQIVVIVGRNERLKARLRRQAAVSHRPVRVLGFTEEVHLWMRAADVVVTKPGGLTVAESLACGLPLVVMNPIPGQETRNSDYLLENGAAIKVNNQRLLGHRVSLLLSNPGRLAAMRAAARTLGRPLAAQQIVADALELYGRAD